MTVTWECSWKCQCFLDMGQPLGNDHASVDESLLVELSLPVQMTEVCPDRGSNPHLPHARQTIYHKLTASVFIVNTTYLKDIKMEQKWAIRWFKYEKNIYQHCQPWNIIEINKHLQMSFRNIFFNSLSMYEGLNVICIWNWNDIQKYLFSLQMTEMSPNFRKTTALWSNSS